MNVKVVVQRETKVRCAAHASVPIQSARASAQPARSRSTKARTKVVYPINAAGDAAIGKWPMMVIGAADINGQAWVSSQLAELEVAERYVTFDMKRSACDKGQPAQIQCTLAHDDAFRRQSQGRAARSAAWRFGRSGRVHEGNKELAFQVKTTKDTPVGSHKTLFCQTTITQNGEPIVCTVGTTELQVNEPPAAAAPAPRPMLPNRQRTPPAAKPLSRLEQLRREGRIRQDGKKP